MPDASRDVHERPGRRAEVTHAFGIIQDAVESWRPDRHLEILGSAAQGAASQRDVKLVAARLWHPFCADMQDLL